MSEFSPWHLVLLAVVFGPSLWAAVHAGRRRRYGWLAALVLTLLIVVVNWVVAGAYAVTARRQKLALPPR